MLHAISYIFFLIIFAKWVEYEFGRSFNLRQYWKWAASAVLAAVIASIIYGIKDDKVGNFILHGLGGGVASGFMYVYLVKTFRINYSWRVMLVGLFAFVSMLGVVNELAEYAIELTGVAIASFDTHDTWRDFVANTLGAVLAWAGVSLSGLSPKTSKKQG